MAVQVAVIAAGTILPFIKKHPWVLILLILASLTPIILVISLFGAISSAVSEIKIPTVASYCQFETSNWIKPANIDFEGQVKKCGASGGGTADKFTPDGEWTLPVPDGAKITSPFGPRCNTGMIGYCAHHDGIDLGVPEGTPVYAAAAGVVKSVATSTISGCNSLYMNEGSGVKINNGNGVETWYWHLQGGSIVVKKGETVKAGQYIGNSGNTGFSCGAHLHFQINVNGSPVDPTSWYNTLGKPIN